MGIALPSVLSLVFVCIGAAILSYAVRVSSRARRSLSWPSTEGEIAHSAVLFQTQSGPTRGEADTFKADIVYRYKVNGRSYSSSRIALLDLASSPGRARDVVSRYPDQSKVDVYYDPADPADAVLEPGSSSGLTFLYMVGAAFAAAGLLFLLLSVTGHVHMASSQTR